MSRYHVDKLLKEIAQDDATFQTYKKNPAEFIAGRDLTDQERQALLALDYKTLYGLGAHPFLLNGFIMRVWPGDRKELMSQYNKTIAPLGRPDFST